MSRLNITRFAAALALVLVPLALSTTDVQAGQWRVIEAVAAREVTVCRDGIRFRMTDWPGQSDATPPDDESPIERRFLAFSPPPATNEFGSYEGVSPLPDSNIAYVDPVLIPRLSTPRQITIDGEQAFHWWFGAFEYHWSRALEPGEKVILQYDYLLDPVSGEPVTGTDGAFFEPAVVTVQECSLVPPSVMVALDIKPGSASNPINLKSKGVIPVAILSTTDFNATTVDPSSVCFGDAEEANQRDCTEEHRKGHVEDVDHDGDVDLVLHFATQETGIDPGDTSASLDGKTVDGMVLRGSDVVRTVGH